ncbi:hypothetical protein EU245_14510 [Lentibacillus lipolyticus]|nr:hypothetical protein EU245_14510 [Lentibacillus lipolyticus]
MHEPRTDVMCSTIPNIAKSDQLTLGQVLLVLRQEHDEKTVQQLTRKYCLQSSSEEIRKKGMEFLYMNGHYEDLQQLIEINKFSGSLSSRNWASVYQLALDRKQQTYSSDEIYRRANSLQTDEPELKALLEFIKIAIHYRRNAYGEFGNFVEKLYKLFDKINDRFLLSFFHIRLYQNLFVYYLVRNEVLIARKYAFRALNRVTNPATKVNLHVNLGLSYVYETYDQGMYHLRKGLEIAQAEQMNQQAEAIEQQNIPFLSAHFGKVDGITSTDKSEQAHIEIAKGNYKQAEAILSDIDLNSPFRLYYLGMAKQSKNLLHQSYNYFIKKRSDYFFSRLPLNALREIW